MIDVWLNGKPESIKPSLTLESAIAEWQDSQQQVAVAINEQFVPRSEYASTFIKAGDRIELLTPMQGG